MKIAETLSISPREVEDLPNEDFNRWWLYFHDVAKVQSTDYYEATKNSRNELSMDQLKAASNTKQS